MKDENFALKTNLATVIFMHERYNIATEVNDGKDCTVFVEKVSK